MDEQAIRAIYEAAGYARATADIVAWLREADNHIDGPFGYCERCHAADAIERGDFRKVTA